MEDEEDYFDVEYLDASLVVDEDIRVIVNNKIETIKEIYNRKLWIIHKKY